MKRMLTAILLMTIVVGVSSSDAVRRSSRDTMPWAAAGLSEREAAAHLLDRFTYGATPGQIDDVVASGLEEWFRRQLDDTQAAPELDAQLSQFTSLNLSNEEIVRMYPRPGRVRREAMAEGYLDEDASGRDMRDALENFYEKKGYRPQRQLLGELIASNVLRAVASPNQLHEVMTAFWFNHFYVSATDNQARAFIPIYERDVIRANALTRFERILDASARHPAMLLYLDNAQSSAAEGVATTADLAKQQLRDLPGAEGERYSRAFEREEEKKKRRRRDMEDGVPQEFRQRRGVNENYARELLELHTLGVDGGYTQEDVEEVARVLTGWTVLPAGERRERIREQLSRNAEMASRLGFVVAGDFLFNADGHDALDKTILGRRFGEGGGLEEGEAVLDMLARHPSTARHISYKLAVRFVEDEPSPALVDELAVVFRNNDGDVRALLWAIVASPEFWAPQARRAKIKSPFEVVVSSVRGLGAEVTQPRQLVEWIDRMGQPLYRYQAPTGFPDNAETWVNAGALLQRMNFGLTLAADRVRGVFVDLDGLLDGPEPESAEAALRVYAAILLPGRDATQTVMALAPMLDQSDVIDEIQRRADAERADDIALSDEESDILALDKRDEDAMMSRQPLSRLKLSQVVGLILGSPEFQRR